MTHRSSPEVRAVARELDRFLWWAVVINLWSLIGTATLVLLVIGLAG